MRCRLAFAPLVFAMGCAPARAPSYADAQRLARGYLPECPAGATAREVVLGSAHVVRECVRDGERAGAFVETIVSRWPKGGRELVSTGTQHHGHKSGLFFERERTVTWVGTSDRVTYRAFDERGLAREQWFVHQGGSWVLERDVGYSGKMVVYVRRRIGARVLEGNLPNGTGDFVVREPTGAITLRGQCASGLREGRWETLDARGAVARFSTYRAGRFEGEQSGGLARDNRPVGRWRVELPERCLKWGEPGSQCGHVSCQVARRAKLVTVDYDDSGKVIHIEGAGSGPDRIEREEVPSPRMLANGTMDCTALATWLGSDAI